MGGRATRSAGFIVFIVFIVMLLNFKELANNTFNKPTALQGVAPQVIAKKSQLAYLQNREALQTYLGDLSEGTIVRYVTKGQWSMHQLFRYICEQLQTPCEVAIATWTITREPAETLAQLKKDGLISRMDFLLDYRIKTHSAKPYQIIESIADSIGLTKCHAKVSSLLTPDRGVCINGSANWTNNPRIEAGTVFCDRTTALADTQWIQAEIQLCKQRQQTARPARQKNLL